MDFAEFGVGSGVAAVGMTETDAGAAWRVFDAVEIDTAGRRLFVSGAEVSLEPKAFDALLLLVERAGRVCTREELLDAVWGHRHITPSVLSRVITLLRQALGEHGDRPRYLHTVHGIGYRFDAEARAVSRPRLRETDAAIETEEPSLDPRQTFGDAFVAVPAPPNLNYDHGRATDPVRSRKPTYAALLLLPLLAVLAIAGWKLWPRTSSVTTLADTAAATEQRSIAVLPLTNTGGDSEQSFLSDGLSENLITTLSQYEGLKVIGRSSSFRFRDGKEDSKTIGAKLGVTHLVEGSVQRAGDNVRIAIQLVRTADGSTVWTQRFDRPYRDLFALQDEIALAVAGALQVRLLHAMPSMVETGRPASGNLGAYEAYLRATADMSRLDYRKAIEEFEQATRIDPDYAQAWSWLALARTLYAHNNGATVSADYAQARKDIDTALRLQPDFGQAHAIRANLLRTADHDWNGALAEFRIALPLVPDADPTHGAVSLLLATLGRVDEAILERRKYIVGDPLAAFARIYLAELLTSRGLLDEAEANLRDADQLNTYPSSATRDWRVSAGAFLAILRGDAATAVARIDTMQPGVWRERWRALAVQIGDDRAAADAALQQLVESQGQTKSGAYGIVRVHALRGDADQAFEWLKRDWERDGDGVNYVLFDPLLLRFRDDPRFAEYCKKAGLPPPSASEALSIDQIRAANALKRLGSNHRVEDAA